MYFRPMTLKDDQGKEGKFADAALGRNNPITLLPEEAISLYGTRRRLGCVVSLGTGSRKAELVQAGKGIMEKGKQIMSVLKVMKEISTDTQRDHENMVNMFKDFPGVYFRFDVDGGAEGISLDQWEKIDQLKARTRAYLQRPEVKTSIDDLAEALVNGNPHGLNLGHLGGLDRDIIIRETQAAKPRGMASTIFTGRESILKRLKTYFDRGDSDNGSRKEYHLWGMGGVGKTQIALKFSEECERNRLTSLSLKIFWIDATDSVTIKQSYLRIAQRLLPADQQGPEAVQKILGILETTDKWLLVFDNAPGNGLAHYMPDGNRGNIIYTSRQKNLERRILPDCRINVNEMEIGDATTLLLRSARMATDIVENRDIARSIARELGFLPLAIDQADIHMDKCPIGSFLEKFNEQKESLLRNPKYKGEDHLRNLPVYATFNISYEAIKAFADKRRDIERAPEATYALQLLHLLCFYHNEGSMGAMFNCAAMTLYLEKGSSRSPLQAEGVSLDHFVQMLHHMEGEEHDFDWQSQSFDLGIAFLEEFSLIRYDYDKLYSNMHVLVHDWARGRMTPRQRSEWGLAARRILIDSLPEKESREIIIHRRQMLPHVDACMRFVGGYDYDLKLESKYLQKIAALYEEADRPEAETAYLRAVRCAAAALGYLDDLTLETMIDAAFYYNTHDRDKEAEELYLETIDRMVIKEDEKRWRATQEKPKQKSGSTSQQESADTRTKEALDSPDLRNAKMLLARLYVKRGDFGAAEKHTGDVLGWGRRFSKTDTGDGEEDEHVVGARELEAQIAGQKPSLLNLPEANRLYLEAEEAHGMDHYETIWRRKRLVDCLLDEEKWKEAEDHLFILQSWYVKTHGPESTEALSNTLSMGYNFRRQLRPWEALWVLSEAMLKFNDKFGANHPKTVSSVSEVARSFFGAGMFETAIEMSEECYNIEKEKFGPDDRRTRWSAIQLRRFKSVASTLPLFHRLRWVQQALLRTKIALADEDAYMPAPPWLAEWEPVAVEPMLTADGTEVRFTQDCLQVDGGTIETWRPLDEAAVVPEQSLLDVVPSTIAHFVGGGGDARREPVALQE
ncbi:hypothetical protein SLS63_000943 [Diaporthe eres]|uniref:NB-ARC domain-containing protein n=1 Tax=Diaporthe eres TaxID=83184 RepID=A0ABR1PNP1_DIAER